MRHGLAMAFHIRTGKTGLSVPGKLRNLLRRCSTGDRHKMDVQLAREQMIEQQIRAWEVLDPNVLDVLADIPRERFAPPAYRNLAFADAQIPIGSGQVMLAPKIEGRLLQALSVQPGDQALEIGTGSGFMAACLAALGATVTSLELHAELAHGARQNLDAAGIANVEVRNEDGARLEGDKTYDVIAVTGSVPRFESSYAQALKVGGRLFVVVGDAPVMEAMLVTRTAASDWLHETLFETVIPPLENVTRPAPFEF